VTIASALVRDGLYPDEAEAMLNTWEASYFKSPGLRAFYIVPKTWTQSILQMTVSADALITRVMIGRIELITPDQRKLVNTIVNGKLSEGNRMNAQKKLGRFADAMIADARTHKSPATLPVGVTAP
jgi:hypothetical protein